MSRVLLDRSHIEPAVLGGALLGGGGGGWITDGTDWGTLAVSLGAPALITVDELPEDALLVTAAAVGAPASPGRFARPVDFLRALELVMEAAHAPIAGIIANENGAAATVNGWLQAAVFGIPVVDAPCNGRAHPTGLMGAMGLHRRPGYSSLQAAVGGDPSRGMRLEVVVRGSVERAVALVRQAAVQAGGMVAVARDPVEAAYVREHGAPGAVAQALEVGRALVAQRERGADAMAGAAADVLGGRVVDTGTVEEHSLQTRGGYDAGRLVVAGASAGYELTFWNEYMTLEAGGERLATFPDLIAIVSAETGLPLGTPEGRPGQRVIIVTAPGHRLILGAGMRDPGLFAAAEEAVGKEIVPYAFPRG